MIKKNRHRAGRKKREMILRAQQRAALASEGSVRSTRPTIRVSPLTRETTEPENRGPPIPLVDLTEGNNITVVDLSDEDTLPLHGHRENSNDIEIINTYSLASSSHKDTVDLEPLVPDIEYNQNISHIFFTIDQYARSVFDNPPSE